MLSRPTSLGSSLILSSYLRLGLTSGLFPIRFPHQNPVCTSPLHHTCYMPRPSHSSWFYYPTHMVKSTNQEAPQYEVFSSPVTSSIFLSFLVPHSRPSSAHGIPLMWDKISHQYKTADKLHFCQECNNIFIKQTTVIPRIATRLRRGRPGDLSPNPRRNKELCVIYRR